MSAPTLDLPLGIEHDGDLVETFLGLDVPSGYRAELVEGEIIVTPPPTGHHETVYASLVRQLLRAGDFDVSGNKGLSFGSNHFIPDLTVGPIGFMRDQYSWAKPDTVLLVAEITSSHPERDREEKRCGYARWQIPLYVLVDRDRRSATLHTKPDAGDYQVRRCVLFGEPLPLPEPFSFELDTAQFA